MRIPRIPLGARAGHRRAAAIGVPCVAAALVLAGGPALAAEPVAELSLSAPASAEVGDVIRVSVAAASASDVYALDLDLAYDPAALEPVDGGDEYLDGGFGASAFRDGDADVAYTRLGTSPGVAGDAELATISFEVLAEGETALTVSGGSLIGTDGESAALGDVAPAAVDVAAAEGADDDGSGDDGSGDDGSGDDGSGDGGSGSEDDADADGGSSEDDSTGSSGDAGSDDGELAVTGGSIAGVGAIVALAAGAVAIGTALVRRRKERA